ncbi:response regulator receiver and SARP domain protein [Paenibacillus cellulosilyticus]|uniref:Response regulator receiver and SARP domain protein n=1 Tax=Paenibacillus cellulosilyticus TaxID=375489 RepID=A0A2V2YSH6_9BACL|nr:response regulator [Paenibacillus cellulosilyticus]PWV98537.1 response regulator receiver and SARP domain protein [Paenibacillus cellulosilyticus]QKS44143.1 response regulator [Paenibacillus cellulosilyticus]
MLRVLLVDAETNNLLLMEALLQAYKGIEIVGKLNETAQALRIIQDGGVDAVILDFEKPIMNGLAALKKMRAGSPELDIIIVTGCDQYAIEAFELNVVDYILKPLVRDRLDNTIERLFWRHKARLQERAAAAEQQFVSSFYCFGHFHWDVSGQTESMIKWKRVKDRELMAYLVHHRNQFVPKEKILVDLWPEANTKQSSAYLYTCVYHIRKMLRDMGCNETLESRNNAYRLRMDRSWCDVDLLDSVLGVNINAANIVDYERVASLYIGSYMEGDGFSWAKEMEKKYQADYVLLSKRMAAFYASEHKPGLVVFCLRRALQFDPFSDELNEMLMTAYLHMGESHAMMIHYEEFARLLHQEHGIEPVSSMKSLYEQTRGEIEIFTSNLTKALTRQSNPSYSLEPE